jgi:UDP-N-acetylglucosamine 2-epimerase
VNTGQHYDYEMNEEFFTELHLPPPTVNLGIGPGSPNTQLSKIILGLEKHFLSQKPVLALVPGDTNSALAAGIACSKLGVPIAHLESGCRLFDIRLSEEINRRVLDHISTLLFCPTRTCLANVRAERVLAEFKDFVGDTMFDSILQANDSISSSTISQTLGLKGGTYAFMTLHRAENVDDPRILSSIIRGVGHLPLNVVFSVHPRTRKRIQESGMKLPPNIVVIPPCSYIDTLALTRGSAAVLTDSGGLEKEAFFLGVPSLVVREGTPWPEIVEAGASLVVGNGGNRILKAYGSLPRASSKMSETARRIFGDGHASEKITSMVEKFLRKTKK